MATKVVGAVVAAFNERASTQRIRMRRGGGGGVKSTGHIIHIFRGVSARLGILPKSAGTMTQEFICAWPGVIHASKPVQEANVGEYADVQGVAGKFMCTSTLVGPVACVACGESLGD